jgi:hypothetical protein
MRDVMRDILGDNTVEARALIRQGLARLSNALFTRAKCAEVLRCLWNEIVVQRKDDTSSWLAANGDVEVGQGTRGIRGSHSIDRLSLRTDEIVQSRKDEKGVSASAPRRKRQGQPLDYLNIFEQNNGFLPHSNDANIAPTIYFTQLLVYVALQANARSPVNPISIASSYLMREDKYFYQL